MSNKQIISNMYTIKQGELKNNEVMEVYLKRSVSEILKNVFKTSVEKYRLTKL